MSAARPRTSATFADELEAARLERLNGHPTGDTFPLFTGDDLLRQPDPSWLIDGIVPASGLSVIYGPSGAGKSFLALDWALCTAAGLPWLGREVEQRRVVYIAAEGRAGFGVRYRAWLAARGLQNVERIGFLLDAVDLRDREQVKRARRTLASLSERPGLLVVDTMARAMVGGDENAAKDVGEFIAAVDGLRENDAAVIVHHTGKDRGSERGSSALRAAADLMAKLERDGQAGRLTLSCDKAKDSAEWDQIPLQLDPAGGSCVLSLVVEKQEARDDLRDRVLAYVVANGPVFKKEIRRNVTGGNPAIDAALLSLQTAHLISRSGNGYQGCPDALGTPGHPGSGATGEGGVPAGGKARRAPLRRHPPSPCPANGARTARAPPMPAASSSRTAASCVTPAAPISKRSVHGCPAPTAKGRRHDRGRDVLDVSGRTRGRSMSEAGVSRPSNAIQRSGLAVGVHRRPLSRSELLSTSQPVSEWPVGLCPLPSPGGEVISVVHEQLVAFFCTACDRAQTDHPAIHPAPDAPLRCQHCGAESEMYDNHLPAAWDHTRVALRWWD